MDTGDTENTESHIKIDLKDEMRVISYIQALSQVILNIAT